MDISKWTKAHFCAYILLCIADADNHLDDNEIDSMQKFLEEMHLENSHELLVEVRELHKKHSVDLRVNFIRTKHQLFFKTIQEITDVMDEIEDLILADNSIDKDEIKMYGKIRKSLDIDDLH